LKQDMKNCQPESQHSDHERDFRSIWRNEASITLNILKDEAS